MNKQQGFVLALLLGSGIVSLLTALPFVQYILAPVLVAYVFHLLNERLRPAVGTRLAPTVT